MDNHVSFGNIVFGLASARPTPQGLSGAPLKSKLVEEYQERKQSDLPDYSIFMAIAEEIGYDATGKKTKNNELEVIGEELKKFIINLDRI